MACRLPPRLQTPRSHPFFFPTLRPLWLLPPALPRPGALSAADFFGTSPGASGSGGIYGSSPSGSGRRARRNARRAAMDSGVQQVAGFSAVPRS